MVDGGAPRYCRPLLVAAEGCRPAVRLVVAPALLALAAAVLQPTAAHAQAILVTDSSLSVNENDGTYDQFVWLSSQPTSDVTVQVASGDLSVATVDPMTLMFTPSNYSDKQQVTYTGVDDDDTNNPNRQTTITFTASGGGFEGVSRITTIVLADDESGAALLRRGFFALFMGSFARGCVSPVAISGGTSSRPARTGVFSAASRASSRRRTPSVFSPTGALPSGHSRGVLVRCRGKGGRPAMAVTTGFQGRTFDVPRTCVPCIDPPRRAPCAAADAVFADAKAFLSSSEARQMSESELERELHRRGQELVRKLLQGHRDQRSPKEAAGPAEDTSGVECSEPREHESPAETASGTMQVVGLGCARRGHDGLHRLDAALNLLPERYLVEMRRRVTIATASRAPPRTPWKPPWYSTSSTWQRRRGVRCSSPAHRRACRHLVRDPMGDDRRSAAAGSRSLDAY